MKVLRQDWITPDAGPATSISKDAEQLQAMIAKMQPAASGEEDMDGDVWQLDGGSEEIEIPDDSVFAEMVQEKTIFLHNDEMDILYNN